MTITLSFSNIAYAAFPSELIEAFENHYDAAVNAKTAHSSGSFRFSVSDSEGTSADGKLTVTAQTDTRDTNDPKVAEQMSFDFSFEQMGDEFGFSGDLSFILANKQFFLKIDELDGKGAESELILDTPFVQEFIGRWIEFPEFEDEFGMDLSEVENVNDPYENLSVTTGIPEDTLDEIVDLLLEHEVFMATKDTEPMNGYAAYTLKINKRGVILFFRDAISLLMEERPSLISISDLFMFKKALLRSKNIRFKVLVDESENMVKGFNIYFATQFTDAFDTKVDVSIVGEMMFDSFNEPVSINKPSNAISIEELMETSFFGTEMYFDEPIEHDDFYYDETPEARAYEYDEEEEARFVAGMAEIMCYLRQYTAERKAITTAQVKQDDIKAIMEVYNPDNDPALRAKVDIVVQRHGFIDYDDFDAVSLKYPPTDELEERVEDTIMERCELEFDFSEKEEASLYII